MNILVINPGSSSIKFSMFTEDAESLRSIYQGEFSGIGEISAALKFHDTAGRDLASGSTISGNSLQDAIHTVEQNVSLDGLPPADAVGYRVVHPGPHLRGHRRITPEVMAELRKTIAYAPLHNPEALQVIDEMMRRMPNLPHFACFDTVFHETMPEEATVYPLPADVRAQGVRRYGFHGLSCESIVDQLRTADLLSKRMLIAHLGSGCSLTACIDSKSIDTSMGLTPMGGVVMGTRPGDIDPGLVIFLLRQPGATIDSVEDMLNRHSGIKVLGGINDMRELRQRAEEGDARAALAIRIFCRSIAKVMISMVVLHNLDTIVFTGGIGQHDAASRAEVLSYLSPLDLHLNPSANESDPRKHRNPIQRISADPSTITVYTVPAEEDRMIARHVSAMCQQSPNHSGQII